MRTEITLKNLDVDGENTFGDILTLYDCEDESQIQLSIMLYSPKEEVVGTCARSRSVRVNIEDLRKAISKIKL